MWWTNKIYLFPHRALFLGKLKLSLSNDASQKFCSKGKHYFKSIIYLLLFIFSSNIFGQRKDIRFEHITTNDGLPQGYVTTIVQDSFGFLWFGTQNGLVKYDGYIFREYRYIQDDTNSIADNWITKIAVDDENNLWVGTGGKGVSKITPTEKIIRYPFDIDDGTGLNASFVSDILVDKDGIIWFATTGGGLTSYSKITDKFKYFLRNETHPNSISDNNTSVLFEDSKGFIWIGTRSCGLDRFDKSTETFM
jgi:ligand-binding sensor domain-containing protein